MRITQIIGYGAAASIVAVLVLAISNPVLAASKKTKHAKPQTTSSTTESKPTPPGPPDPGVYK